MRRILLAAVLALAGSVAVPEAARADTLQFRGVNWADQRYSITGANTVRLPINEPPRSAGRPFS